MNNKLSYEDLKYIKAVYKPHDRHYGAKALATRFGVRIQTITTAVKRMTNGNTEPLEEYIENKIIMLQYEFYIKLTEAELIHLRALKSESEVDRYAHDILKNRL